MEQEKTIPFSQFTFRADRMVGWLPAKDPCVKFARQVNQSVDRGLAATDIQALSWEDDMSLPERLREEQ